MKKALNKFFIILAVLFFLVSPLAVLASSEKEVKAAVAVAAVVPSKVCAQYSSTTINVTEILADASQKATITVKLEDCAQVVMSDISVSIYTDRGAVDILNFVNDKGQVVTAGNGTGVLGKTDVNGYAFFQIYSKVPGKTLIDTVVDNNMVDLNQLSLTFKPLPFPKYVTVSAQVPKYISPSGEVTVFKPSKTEDLSSDELVNLGVRIVIPSWIVSALVFFTILTPILFALVLVLLSKIKKINNQAKVEIERTEQLVEKEEQEIEKLVEKDGGSGSSPTSSI